MTILGRQEPNDALPTMLVFLYGHVLLLKCNGGKLIRYPPALNQATGNGRDPALEQGGPLQRR
jgi:hypothetical protein